jgi:hypothetical protein
MKEERRKMKEGMSSEKQPILASPDLLESLRAGLEFDFTHPASDHQTDEEPKMDETRNTQQAAPCPTAK